MKTEGFTGTVVIIHNQLYYQNIQNGLTVTFLCTTSIARQKFPLAIIITLYITHWYGILYIDFVHFPVNTQGIQNGLSMQ